MFTYIFDNPSQYNELLQFVALFLLFVIGLMVYFISQKAGDLNKQIAELEMECPTPNIPPCPEIKCPQCPSLTCDNGKCPDCVCPASPACPDCNKECPQCPDCNKECPQCPDSEHKCPKCPACNKNCPKCPDCKANAKCPTVEDIIGGIFPGRNTGVTQGGKFFDVKSSESYDLMPDYDFYEPQAAFPSDSILSTKTKNTVSSKNSMEVDSFDINLNTSVTSSLGGSQVELGNVSMDDMPRMGRGNMGVPGNGSNNSMGSNGLPTPARSLSPKQI